MESRARTRTDLLDAAESVFAERGFHGATLEQVAERAGYTRGALYWNFKDKDDLFAAVVERRSDERLGAIEEHRRRAADSEAFLDALRAADTAAGGAERARRWHLLAVEQLAYALRNPGAGKRIAAQERKINAAMGELAAAVYAERDLEPPLPQHQLGIVVHALDWGLRMQRQLNKDDVPGDLLYRVLDLLLSATSRSAVPAVPRTPDVDDG